jgi:hypothetical protein
MAFTGTIIAISAISAGASAVEANQLKQKQKGEIGAMNRALQQSIAATPPPPSASTQNDQAAAAMTAAAARQRRIAANAPGFSSTVLTSPTGAPPAMTQRKALIGQ